MLRVIAINSVGAFVLFLGKAVVVISVVFIGIEIIEAKNVGEEGRVVQYVWLPVLLGAICAYLIADTFIGVYGMAIDTIFLCFCEDSDRNDGIRKPYYMSKGLMEFVTNSSKALEALETRKKRESKLKRRSSISMSRRNLMGRNSFRGHDRELTQVYY